MICFSIICMLTCGLISWQIWQRLAIMSLIVVMALFHDSFMVLVCISHFDVDLILCASSNCVFALAELLFAAGRQLQLVRRDEMERYLQRKYSVWHQLWRVCSVLVYLSEISKPWPWKVSTHSPTGADSTWTITVVIKKYCIKKQFSECIIIMNYSWAPNQIIKIISGDWSNVCWKCSFFITGINVILK